MSRSIVKDSDWDRESGERRQWQFLARTIDEGIPIPPDTKWICLQEYKTPRAPQPDIRAEFLVLSPRSYRWCESEIDSATRYFFKCLAMRCRVFYFHTTLAVRDQGIFSVRLVPGIDAEPAYFLRALAAAAAEEGDSVVWTVDANDIPNLSASQIDPGMRVRFLCHGFQETPQKTRMLLELLEPKRGVEYTLDFSSYRNGEPCMPKRTRQQTVCIRAHGV